MARTPRFITLLLTSTVIMGLHAALYKPYMVGVQRDVPPEGSGPVSPPALSKEENSGQFPAKLQQQELGPPSRGLDGPFPAEKSSGLTRPDSSGDRYNNEPPPTDSGYSRGLARNAPLAPPAGRVKPYISDGYKDASSPSGPKSVPGPTYPGRGSPNDIAPAGYANRDGAGGGSNYEAPQKPPQPPPISYSSKPNPFIDPRSSQAANPYSPNAYTDSSARDSNTGQSDGGGTYYPSQNQPYPHQNSYQPKEPIQQPQPNQISQPYGPSRPSEQGGNPSNSGQFNVPGALSSKLDNSIPPPPGTNKNTGSGNTLPGGPAFPAPFGFPESLKVGQNSPFKNLVSFNSPRPFKSRASIPFPDSGNIFGGFSNTNYDTPAVPATAAPPEGRPAAPASRPAYRVDYPAAREARNPYSPPSRGSNPAYRPQDGGVYEPAVQPASLPANPYSFPAQRGSNLGYGFPSQNGALYGNPYSYGNSPSGQCFRYTYAAEGYRLSDIAKSYPEEAIKKELEGKPYLAPLAGLKVSPKKQQGFGTDFFQFDYSRFGFNSAENNAEKYEYLLNSKVYPGNFKQGDFSGGYPSSMRPLDTSCPSQEYKLRSFFHHGGDCYVVNPEWQLITYNRCSRRECNFCGVNRGLSACVEDYRWFTVVAYCSKLTEGSRIVPLRLILPVGCTCQHFAC